MTTTARSAPPSRATTFLIRERLLAGAACGTIRRELGWKSVRWIEHLLKDILDGIDAYDPEDDEVAIERAVQGDRAVWDRLTHWEREETLLRIRLRFPRRPTGHNVHDEQAHWVADSCGFNDLANLWVACDRAFARAERDA